MKSKMKIAALGLFAILATAGAGTVLARGPPPPQGWDAAPDEYQAVSRMGFHDGIKGAHRDFENHRRPDVNNREEYRHPSIPRRDRFEYRRGFERGYQVGVSHLYGPPRRY